FLQALCLAVNERLDDIQEAGSALPLPTLVARVNNVLENRLKPYKLTQVSRLTGKELEGGAPVNPAEAPPPRIVIQMPATIEGNDVAGRAEIERLLDDLNAVPPP